MQLRKHFPMGEEGYALDAFTSDKLAELGYQEIGKDKDSGARVYRNPGNDDEILMRMPGTRESSIINYGTIVRKVWQDGGWQERGQMDLEAFINADIPFALPARSPEPALQP